mgnify:FL=1
MAGLKLTEDLEKILDIFAMSPIHKKYTIEDIQRLIIPPLKLGQYRLFQDRATPIGYISWAFLNAETVENYINNKKLLQADDWNSGKALWLINVICPKGGAINAMLKVEEKRKLASKGTRYLGDGGGLEAGKDFSNIFYRKMNKEKSSDRIFRVSKRI